MRKFHRYVGLPLLAACGAIAACSSDPEPTDLAGQLEKDTGTPWTVYTDPRSHEVRFLAPKTPVPIGQGTPEEKARAFFARYSDALHTSGKSDEIRLVSTATDARGGTHIRFAHFLSGTELPVFGSGSTAHFTPDGAVYWLQADFRADLADVDGNATVTKEAALATAVAHVKSSCGAVQGPPTASAADLGVLSDPDTHAALAYRVQVSVQSEGCRAPAVFVDAKSGAALKIEEGAHAVQEPTVGGSLFFRLKDFRDVKPISVTTVPNATSRFQMSSDDEPSLRVLTRSFVTGAVIQTGDIAHWDESSSAKGAAVDAHFHTREALRFLRSFPAGFAKHQREGLVFPLSRDVNAFVHDNSAANSNGFNAFATFDEATRTDIIHFGDGKIASQPNALPFSAAYDVVAHELTHLVTIHTSNLKYERESGALNESFSDVMGAAAEHAREPDDKNNFLIGEKLFAPGEAGTLTVLRSMTAPRSVSPPSPDHTSDEIPCPSGPSAANDQCGVHANSGIPNRAFSLIVRGGSVTRFVDGKAAGNRVIGVERGIDWEAATELTYWATTGLNATATFENAALAQIAEARFVGGSEAALIVACAWSAVGVPRISDEAAEVLGSTLCKAPAPVPAPPLPVPSGVNVCEGRGDALICDPAVASSAVQCKNGVLVPNGIEECADTAARCQSVSADDPTALRGADGLIVCL
jgi:Zn-dependent metalloprotease